MPNLFSPPDFPDQLARVEAMALDVATWQENLDDCAALIAVLEDRKQMAATLALAKRCRQAQKTYFRERTDSGLQAAKDLERRLDAALKEWG